MKRHMRKELVMNIAIIEDEPDSSKVAAFLCIQHVTEQKGEAPVIHRYPSPEALLQAIGDGSLIISTIDLWISDFGLPKMKGTRLISIIFLMLKPEQRRAPFLLISNFDLTDPHLDQGFQTLYNDGVNIHRMKKTEFINEFPPFLQHCWR
jgi:hypothetical protein